MNRSSFAPVPTLLIALLMLIISVNTLPASTLPSSEANAIYSSANAAYRAEKFDEAKAGYKTLLESGYKTPAILYNIGTAAARLNQYDEAIGYLTFASRLDPHNPDIEVNLARAHSQHPSNSPAISNAESARGAFLPRLLDSLTTSEWLLLCWIPFALLCISLGILTLISQRPLARAFKFLSVLCGIFFTLFVIPAAIQVYRTRYMPESIALASAQVHSGPGKSFTVITTVKPGDVLHSPALGETSDFRSVRLPDGRKGYVPTDSVLSLR